MATIVMTPATTPANTWTVTWAEQGEVVAYIFQDSRGDCRIKPLGPHFNPMKSFAGSVSKSPEKALAELKLYFGDR